MSWHAKASQDEVVTLNNRWLGPVPACPGDGDRAGDERRVQPTTVVLLHGFTQNIECWGRFGSLLTTGLPDRFPVLAIDAPGHGGSGHDTADLWTTADLVVDTVRHAGGLRRPPSMVPIGYSMGGRSALHIALAHPERVRVLVLIGATAGIVDDDQRRERRLADERLAGRFENEPLDQMLRWWLDRPLFAGLSDDTAGFEPRRSNRRDGLAASLRACGTGAQQSLWDRLDKLTMPVLMVHGSRDTKFAAIAAAMADLIGGEAEVTSIDGSHAVHLEQPESTAEAIVAFLSRRLGGGERLISGQ